MGFLGLFSDKADKRRNQQGMGKFGARSDDDYQRLIDLIGSFSNQSDQAYAEGDQTVEQRFGDMLSDQTEQINAQGAASRSNIMRSAMAGGGDFSGSNSVALAQTNQGANQAIQDAFNYYNRANVAANERSKRRGDNLLSQQAGLNQGLYQFDTGNLQNYELREIQRRQADRQTLANMIGGGLGLAGSIFGG